MSVKASAYRFVMRHFANMNPTRCPDTIGAMQHITETTFNTRLAADLELSQCKTPDGVRYELGSLRGTAPNGRLVLCFHGGAYLAGLANIYRNTAVELGRSIGAEVAFLDYDLAPEHRYPVQLEQAMALWNELTKRYAPENIVVVGDSAGGNLALAFLLKLRDGGFPMPRCGLCFSPLADTTASGRSYIENYQNDVLFGHRRGHMTDELRSRILDSDIYAFCKGLDRTNPYISPVFGDFTGFPPMFLCAGGHELLLSDTTSVAERMTAQGVKVELEIGDRMFHDYIQFHEAVPEGKEALEKAKRFVERQW